jgi:WD40 repeat protein/predicted Ser/Thr protein kinase
MLADQPPDRFEDSWWDLVAAVDELSERYPDLQFEQLLTRIEADTALSTAGMRDRLRDHHSRLKAVNGLMQSQDAPERPAVQIPGFELLDVLGYGGAGVVCRARQSSLGRDVAIKLMLGGRFASQRMRARFRREAETAARLQHPNIAQIYDHGQVDDVPYLVEELVTGGTLHEWIQDQSPSVRECCELLETLAEAVEYAHSQGILHRDLKPGNILLTNRGQPKIVDFGLAKTLDAENEFTRTYETPGTPSYMAPEQAGAQGGQLGPPTDVYALGAILYECLTRRRVFEGDTFAHTVKQVLDEPPKSPRRIRSDLPRDLEAVVLKCLEKPSARRYQSAGALAADLQRFLSDRPTVARPTGPLQKMWKAARRRPAISALLLLAVTLASALGIGQAWYAARLARQEQAVLQHDYARDMLQAFDTRSRGQIDVASKLLAKYEEGTRGSAVRGFEWYWLLGALHQEAFTIAAGHGEAYAVAFSPDGKWVLSGGQDGVIRAWDLRTHEPVFELKGHTACVNALTFSRDGMFASASCDKTVRIWDLATRRETKLLNEHPAEVLHAAFAHDHDWLATADQAGNAIIWDAREWQPIKKIESKLRVPMNAVHFRADDQQLIAVGQQVTIWNTNDWTAVSDFGSRGVSAVFIGNQPEIVLGAEHDLLLVDSAGQVKTTLGHLEQKIDCLAISKQGVLFAAGNDAVHAFALNGNGHRAFSGGASRVQCLALSPQEDLLATASYDGAVRVWETKASRRKDPEPLKSAPGFAVFSRNAERMVIVAGQRIYGWLSDGEKLGDTEFPHTVHSPVLSPSGRLVVLMEVNTAEGRLLSMDGMEVVQGFERMPSLVGVALSGDDAVIATIDMDHRLVVREIATGRELYCREVPAPTAIAGLNLNGSLVLLSAPGKPVATAIDVQTGHDVEVPRDLSFLAGGSFSPDGSRLFTGSGETLQIRDSRTGALLQHFTHPKRLTGKAAWSRDGRRVAIQTFPETIVLYDTASGALVGELEGALGTILSNLVFTPDGKSLVALVRSPDGKQACWQEWTVAD